MNSPWSKRRNVRASSMRMGIGRECWCQDGFEPPEGSNRTGKYMKGFLRGEGFELSEGSNIMDNAGWPRRAGALAN